MEELKTYINENKGLRYVFEKLEISSAAGRKRAFNQDFITDPFRLRMELDILEECIEFVKKETNRQTHIKIQNRLSQLNDIHQTIENLKSSQTLDDVELFEIKNFCMTSQEICKILSISKFDILPFYDLSEIINILDPEKSGIPSFYIYSAYNEELARLRKKYEAAKQNHELEIAEKIRLASIIIEDEIRKDLSEKIKKFGIELQSNYKQLAYLDFLLAKAIFAIDNNLCKPEISENGTKIFGAINLLVKAALRERGCEFQSTDISFNNLPILITGANMSGKTVILKTVSLIQYLFQFGFFVPAQKAQIAIVDEIMFSIGDAQSEINGLSSFAIEMQNIDKILKAVKSGKHILALVDELARTTNPDEGKALVNAFIKILAKYKTCSLITTHYSGISSDCKRLRVKGLKISNEVKITPKNINQYMDYSLIETDSKEVPTEGLAIAEIFEIDEEFIQEAKRCVSKKY